MWARRAVVGLRRHGRVQRGGRVRAGPAGAAGAAGAARTARTARVRVRARAGALPTNITNHCLLTIATVTVQHLTKFFQYLMYLLIAIVTYT